MLAACDEHGASVAMVAKAAMARGINASVVHRWRQLARKGKVTPALTGEFIALPLMMTPQTALASADNDACALTGDERFSNAMRDYGALLAKRADVSEFTSNEPSRHTVVIYLRKHLRRSYAFCSRIVTVRGMAS